MKSRALLVTAGFLATVLLFAVTGAVGANEFALTVVTQNNSTITFSYPQQSGYGYLYSANGNVVSRTNNPAATQVRFSKNTANSYEVASIVKGTTGTYNPAPPPPPPPPAAKLTQSIANGSTIPDIVNWRAVYDVNNDGQEDDPGQMTFSVDGTVVLSEEQIPFGDSFADGSFVIPDGQHTFKVQASSGGTVLATNTVTATVKAPPPPPPPPPPTGDFPNASNTGVPAGTTLTTYTGPSNITTPNTVIDGKTMGCIDINAANVLIKNSKISCGGTDYYAVFVDNGSLTIQDSEIDCQNRSSNGEGGAFVTYIRVEISLCENGASPEHDFTIRDSYIHDLYEGGDAHGDGMQAENAAYNIRVIHNTIIGMGSNGDRATSAIISDLPTMRDWTIQGNWLSGGQYTLYCATGPDPGYEVRDNAFALQYGVDGYSGHYGFATECGDDVQSGNYVYETGQPIFLP